MRYLAIILLLPSFALGGLVSPTSHDPVSEEFWENCSYAYDNSRLTYASTFLYEPLDLFFSPSVNSYGGYVYASSLNFEFWLFYDGNWHQQWTPIANNFASETRLISAARIVPTDALFVYEVELKELPEPSSLILLGILSVFFVRKTK